MSRSAEQVSQETLARARVAAMESLREQATEARYALIGHDSRLMPNDVSEKLGEVALALLQLDSLLIRRLDAVSRSLTGPGGQAGEL
jgi:hypothetical protein